MTENKYTNPWRPLSLLMFLSWMWSIYNMAMNSTPDNLGILAISSVLAALMYGVFSFLSDNQQKINIGKALLTSSSKGATTHEVYEEVMKALKK